MAKKVFIADDSKNIHKVIEIILEDRNCEFEVSTDDGDLFTQLGESKPDLIFLDFHFSDELDGYELARKIKLLIKSKVVLIFGTFDNVDDFKLEEYMVDNYLFKPIDGDKLLNIFDLIGFDTSNIEVNHSENSPVSLDEDFALPEIIEEEFKEVKASDVSQEEDLSDFFGDLDLPEVIGGSSENEEHSFKEVNPSNDELEVDLPDIIVDNFNLKPADQVSEESESTLKGFNLPTEEDLEYPSLLHDEVMIDEPVTDVLTDASSVNSPSPKFTPSDVLLEVDEDEAELEIEFRPVILDKKQEEKKLDELKSSILKELDHDLWDGDNTNTHISTLDLREELELDKQKIANLKEELSAKFESDLVELKSEIHSSFEGKNLNIQSEVNSLKEIFKSEMKALKLEVKEELRLEFEQKIKSHSSQNDSLLQASVLESVKSLKGDVRDEVLNTISSKINEEIPSLDTIRSSVSPKILDQLRAELQGLVTSEVSVIIDEKIWKEIPAIAEKVISQELNEIKNSIIN